MQSKEELEVFSEKEDPWGYKTNPEDIKRKHYILSVIKMVHPVFFDRALDIGAHEGFITKDLPAIKIYGYEISDNAASRFPRHVKRVLEPDGQYELVLATGVLYQQYDWQHMVNMMIKHSSGYIISSNIKSWEVEGWWTQLPHKQILYMEYPYREYTQALRVFEI